MPFARTNQYFLLHHHHHYYYVITIRFYCRCRRCQCISIRVENAVVCAMKIKNKTTFSFGCLPLLVQRQQIFVFEFETACCLNQSLHVQRLANLSVEFQYHNTVFYGIHVDNNKKPNFKQLQ